MLRVCTIKNKKNLYSLFFRSDFIFYENEHFVKLENYMYQQLIAVKPMKTKWFFCLFFVDKTVTIKNENKGCIF